MGDYMFKRVLTAVIGIPIVLFIVIQGAYLFDILAYIIAITTFSEYSRITRITDKTLLTSSYLLAALIIFVNIDIVSIIILYLFLGGIYLRVFKFEQTTLMDLGTLTWGIFYIYLPLFMLKELRHLDQGVEIIFLLLIIVWLTDSGAYFVGRSLGKNKLAEKISPKKTIEGSLGGTTLAIIGVIIFTHYFLPDYGYIVMAIFAIVGSVIGQVRDLFESAIKREYQVKDSGNILPGHGGALDRIDSLLFLIPLSYVFFMYIL